MKQLKILILLLILSAYCKSFSQNNYSTQLNIYNKTENLFSKPKLIDSLLKEKSIVMLGELDHGDGSTFIAKTKVIKYLHEKLGYNTIAFETGLINCHYLWNFIKSKNVNSHDIFKENIFYIWSKTKELEELFDYILEQNKTDTPLKIIGIDPQFSGNKNHEVFIEALKNNLSKDIYESDQFKNFQRELKLISVWMEFPSKQEHFMSENDFLKYTLFLKDKIMSKTNERELWKLFFKNIEVLASIKCKPRKNSFAKRDKQMFENLDYYLSKNKEKIIIWAANAHIIRNDSTIENKSNNYKLNGIKKLGDHIYQKYQNKIYTIAFTANSGKTLDWPSVKRIKKIKKANKNSFRDLANTNSDQFISLKLFEQHFKLKNYEAQLINTYVKGVSLWSNHYDGVILIKEMKPSTPLWKHPW